MPSVRTRRFEARIEFDPDLFVAQERVELSTAPSWDKNSLVAQPVSLRVFSWRMRGRLCVMPGGLTRVLPDSGGNFISMQRGGGSSKDTWIPSATPVEEVTLLHSTNQNVELRRTGNNLPSRLADNFFWLGRYSERADATSRLLRSALLRFQSRTHRRRAAAACAAAADARNAGPVAGHFRQAGIVAERRGVRGGTARGDF
jgi:hypothetical protein